MKEHLAVKLGTIFLALIVVVGAQRIQYTPPPGGSSGSAPGQSIVMMAQTSGTQTALGAGGAEMFSSRFKVIVDTEHSTQVALMARFIASCAGTPATLELQYSLDGNTWVPIPNTGISCVSATTVVAPFVALPVAAQKVDIWYRGFFTDGTTGTPGASNVIARFR